MAQAKPVPAFHSKAPPAPQGGTPRAVGPAVVFNAFPKIVFPVIEARSEVVTKPGAVKELEADRLVKEPVLPIMEELAIPSAKVAIPVLLEMFTGEST